MFMELTLLVCSIVHGATCKETALTFADEGQMATPYGCALGGMHRIVEWQQQHPNWSVKRWGCGPAGRVARI